MSRHRSHGPGLGNGHGPANGPGWGGPARGAGWGGLARAYSGTHQPSPECRNRRTAAERAQRWAQRDARANALEDMLYDLALKAEREETQIAAAVRLHATLAGRPVARTMDASTELSALSDDQLTARIRARLAELARQ